MHWSESEYAAYLRQHGQVPRMGPSERAFQGAVVRLATQHGWAVHTVYNSRRSPAGWPDVTLAKPPHEGHPGTLLIAELKVPGGVVTLAQQHWLEVLRQVSHIEVYLWKPDDWPEIVEKLLRK